jgi:hypothetical protein
LDRPSGFDPAFHWLAFRFGLRKVLLPELSALAHWLWKRWFEREKCCVRARGKLASGKVSPSGRLRSLLDTHTQTTPAWPRAGVESGRTRGTLVVPGGSRKGSYLVDPASSHMLVKMMASESEGLKPLASLWERGNTVKLPGPPVTPLIPPSKRKLVQAPQGNLRIW